MKKIGYKIFLSTILGISLLSNSALAQKEEITQDKDRELTDFYMDKCFKEVYPEDKKALSKVLSYTNDNAKQYARKYHQCLKNIIIQEIKQVFSPEGSNKMLVALDNIETGTLTFYNILYNQDDTGYMGRAQNDIILGRQYEEILYDILHYQTLYENDVIEQ